MQTKTRRLLFCLTAFGLILSGIGVAYAVARANSGVYRIPTAAMEPTIIAGDTFRADMSAYSSTDPKRWDLVVFRSPQNTDRTWVFRVIGLPGETISFVDRGLLIDGKPVDLPSHLSGITYSGSDENTDPVVVPNESYYVLGDNSDKANDSRYWGAVSRDAILGRVTGL